MGYVKPWFLLALVLLAACTAPVVEEKTTMEPPKPIVETHGDITVETPGGESMEGHSIERVTLTTSDGKRLAGNLYLSPGTKSIILLHQLNHDKTSWDAFAKELQQEDWSLLALDLRGHGESEGNWESFSDASFVAMLEDVKAAASFLSNREKQVKAIMGASIGANTAFRFSSNNRVPAVLLSPGLEYRGIDINNITSSAPTLIIVAEGDSYSHSSSVELEKNNLFGAHELLVLDGDEHGTYLLPKAGVRERIKEFLDKQER